MFFVFFSRFRPLSIDISTFRQCWAQFGNLQNMYDTIGMSNDTLRWFSRFVRPRAGTSIYSVIYGHCKIINYSFLNRHWSCPGDRYENQIPWTETKDPIWPWTVIPRDEFVNSKHEMTVQPMCERPKRAPLAPFFMWNLMFRANNVIYLIDVQTKENL